MAAEQGGVPAQEDVPCAARGISELVTQLAHENEIPFQEVSMDTVNVTPDELYSHCDACDGIAKFRGGGIEASQCLSVRSGLKSCIRSWIALYPEVWLDEDGTLTSPEIECSGESGKYICLAQFLLTQAEDGTVTTDIDRGICLVELEGKKFQKNRWDLLESEQIQLGEMTYLEDESGEVVYAEGAVAAGQAEQTDAEDMGDNTFDIEVEVIETETEDND